MRFILSCVLTLTVIAIAASLGVLGCSDGARARVSVAQEAATKKLDEMLGSMDVKRKEIDIQLKGFSDGLAGVRKAKLKAEVKIQELTRAAEPALTKLREIDSTLKKYRELLTKNETVELAGTTITPEQLKANAEKLIQGRKQITEELQAYDASKAELLKVVGGFDLQHRELNTRITALKSRIAQIDSQMVAVKALGDAKSAMGDGSSSMGENVSRLEDKVDTLLADVKVELGNEGLSFDESTALRQIDAVDSIIAAAQEPTDTLSEIDKILGNVK